MRKIEHQVINGIECKWCSKCKQWKPINEFGKCNQSWDGLQYWCNECRHQHHINNRETILAKHKKYYADHREDRLKKAKQYRDEHPERMKQWRYENRYHIKEYGKQYYRTLKGHCNQIWNSNLKYDRKKGLIPLDSLPSNYPTVEDYMHIVQQVDYYDGKQYPFIEMGADRIDNSKPHTLDNIVPASTKHNIERGSVEFNEYLNRFTYENK